MNCKSSFGEVFVPSLCETASQPSRTCIAEQLNRETSLLENRHISVEQVLQLFPKKANNILQIPKTLDQWRNEIRKQYPEAKDFLVLTRSERAKFNMYGKGLKAVAGIFGLIRGFPVEYIRDFLSFLEMVYGKENTDIQKAIQDVTQKINRQNQIDQAIKEKNGEYIRTELKKRYPQKHRFFMTKEKRKRFYFFGYDLTVIAALYDVKCFDPIASDEGFDRLVEKIYQ